MTPTPAAISAAAMAASFPVFLTVLRDSAGRPLEVPAHFVVWAGLLQDERRLVLRAPRGHGKTTLLLAYALWCCWRHNRTASGWATHQEVPGFDAVLFSATTSQALELMARFRDLLLANAELFAPLLPDTAVTRSRRTRWSATEIRLRNRAQLRIRAFGASVRGLHPDLLLLDDVLNDANSLTSEQRDKTYRYFMATLMPMHARELIVIGTAFHQDDLLARLGRGQARGTGGHTALGFRMETYRALDEATGETLWPERFTREELLALRDEDPVSFSREYQNDPRDDGASLFPFPLTEYAIDAGAAIVLGEPLPLEATEIVVMGLDLARSGAAAADYSVAIVVVWNAQTGVRRVVDIRREKGLEFERQIALVAELFERYRIGLALIEDNGFQRWLLDALAKVPRVGGRIAGHTTGTNKADGRDGLPRLALQFRLHNWVIPSGDHASRRLARQLQHELGAHGYQDGRLKSAARHDDMAIAAWLVERAIARYEELLAKPQEEIITGEDLGIEPVVIGLDYG